MRIRFPVDPTLIGDAEGSKRVVRRVRAKLKEPDMFEKKPEPKPLVERLAIAYLATMLLLVVFGILTVVGVAAYVGVVELLRLAQ